MSTKPHFQVLAKPIGPVCNMDCSYCFYLEKEKMFSKNNPGKKSDWTMPDDVLEIYIRQMLDSKDSSTQTFIWQGGEPTLLGVDYFRKIVEIQQKYNNGKKTRNALQTNGILLNNEWCEFFAENNILIGISIDGPQNIHNKYRLDRGGNPSFDKVLHGINLLKKHQVEFNTLTAVHRWNSLFPLETYNFLKEIGSHYLQFIPVVEKNEISDLKIAVSDWSVDSKQYGKFLISIFDEWVRNDVGKYFVQNFDVALETWYGKPSSLCIFNETCGYTPVIEHNGDIFSCDHFVYSKHKVGNIFNNSLHELMQSAQQIKFGNEKLDTLPRFCRKCNFLFACHGECPKNRFLYTGDGEFGLNYLCAGYQLYFEHIDLYMKFMVKELENKRPPANVMYWIQEKKNEFDEMEIDTKEIGRTKLSSPNVSTSQASGCSGISATPK